MFRSTRLKLTGWYLLMIMLISIFFSVVIYANVDRELVRLEKIQEVSTTKAKEYFGYASPFGVTDVIGENLIDEARGRLITDLAILNTCIFLAAGVAGYFLAGRTLDPIKGMLDTQSRFLADASHELKTPLTSLRTEIEIYLRGKVKTLKNSENILKSNLEEVIKLQNLTNSLMELSTLEKAGQKMSLEKLSMDNIVKEALAKVERLAKGKKIEIKSKCKKCYVMGNAKSLMELIVILLDNAIKFSPTATKINLSCSASGKVVSLQVEDQGVGIDEKDLDHVFERFYRADKSRSGSKTPGHGLGLSIAKEIVNLHNGQIYARSLKNGTIFTVEIPRA